jgi:hypothetical protein
MTLDREDIIWVAIRIFGLYFLARAMLLIPEIYGAISWLHYLGPAVESLSRGIELSVKTTQTHLLNSSLSFVLFSAVGLYFLRRGQFVFKLIKLPSKSLGSNTSVERDAK